MAGEQPSELTRRAAVLGHPIGHSLSPVLHRAAYTALGLDWRYDAIDVTEEALPGFLAGLDRSWAGLSLTMPLKKAVLPHLSSASGTVAEVGGANTVVVAEGRLVGHNTDVDGITEAVRRAAAGSGEPRSAAIIGAGATASAALVASGRLGARDITVAARRAEPVAALVAHGRALGLPVRAGAWDRLADVLAADLVIVTLPGDAAAALADVVPARPGVLLDVTYHPWPTTLAAAWQRAGGDVVAGHRMLLWQAVRQVELMTGLPAPHAAMAAALDRALGRDFGLGPDRADDDAAGAPMGAAPNPTNDV